MGFRKTAAGGQIIGTADEQGEGIQVTAGADWGPDDDQALADENAAADTSDG